MDENAVPRRCDEVIQDIGGVIRVLAQCEEFVGFFGGQCDDELLPQIRSARAYLQHVCQNGRAVNLTYVVPPPTRPVRLDNVPPPDTEATDAP